MTLICIIGATVIGFVVGVLFGRKNRKIADSMATTAKAVETKIQDTASK